MQKDGAARLGEQMVMRPVAGLKGLKNLVSNSTLFAWSRLVPPPSLSTSKETQRKGAGGGRGGTWAGSTVRNYGMELATCVLEGSGMADMMLPHAGKQLLFNWSLFITKRTTINLVSHRY